MVFADLKVGDHFVWPIPMDLHPPDSLNVNIKIAWAEDGGGFAIDMATRKDCVNPTGSGPNEPISWIPGNALVIKLNGVL
jgi:hypothetical protein